MAEERDFTFKEALNSVQACLTENKELKMDEYMEGWRELVRFLKKLGIAFSFISYDLLSKLQIMTKFRNGEDGDRYVTIQSMVKYELDNNLVDIGAGGSHPESGCRTVLRLHRALRWLELFLDRMRTSTPSCKTSDLCWEAYSVSLAQFHPWIIQEYVYIASLTLPERRTFFDLMNAGTPVQVVALLGEALPYISEVYKVTQDLYAKHNLLAIP